MSKKNSATDLIKVKRSSIHGNGVFAIVDIPKNKKIIELKDLKEKVKRIETKINNKDLLFE